MYFVKRDTSGTHRRLNIPSFGMRFSTGFCLFEGTNSLWAGERYILQVHQRLLDGPDCSTRSVAIGPPGMYREDPSYPRPSDLEQGVPRAGVFVTDRKRIEPSNCVDIIDRAECIRKNSVGSQCHAGVDKYHFDLLMGEPLPQKIEGGASKDLWLSGPTKSGISRDL